MAFDLHAAINYATEVRRVEQVPPSDVEDYSGTEVNGRTVRATIFANDKGGGPVVSFGQVLQSPDGRILVAIRGTSDTPEWWRDAEFVMTDCPFFPGKVERGFLDIYKTMHVGLGTNSRNAEIPLWTFLLLWKKNQVTIAGHSLGGALATLLAANLFSEGIEPEVYTLESPRVGNADFAKAYTAPRKMSDPLWENKSYRIANKGDIVTEVPTISGFHLYHHVGELYELRDVKSRSLACRHHLTTVLHLLTTEMCMGVVDAAYPLDRDCE